MKKTTAIFMASLIGASFCVVGTGCREAGTKIDEKKTQLYVSNHDAGIGRSWIEAIGKQFEEDFANYSFEEGKTGVQVIYNHNTSNNSETTLEQLETNEDYIYFTESIDYTTYAKKFSDVTDVMNAGAVTGVDASGNITREEKTIESKIDGTLLNFLNRGTAEQENYRALPFYLGLKSLNYDVDLWNENKFFLAKGYCPSDIVAKAIAENGDVNAAIQSYNTEIAKIKTVGSSDCWLFVDKNGEYEANNGTKAQVGLSAGPDGKYGTYDDGLPATYEEFYLFLNKISADVVPIIYYSDYADMLTTALWQNNETVSNLNVYYSLNGTVDNLVQFDENNNIIREDGKIKTGSVTFNGGKDNGYEIQRTIEKYHALQFAQQIALNPSWTHSACFDGTSQSGAQSKYLTEGNTATGQGIKRIAMIIDGAWWQQEANTTFEIMKQADSKYAKEAREFAMMPLPNSTIERLVSRVENNEKNIMVAANDSFVYLNGNLTGSALEVSKTFLSYVSNDENLNRFTEYTSMLRPFDYEISTDTESKISLYGKNLVKLVENTDVVYPYSSNTFMNANYATFANSNIAWNWHSYSTKETYQPMKAIRLYYESEGLDAETYFKGLYYYYKNKAWPTLDMNV